MWIPEGERLGMEQHGRRTLVKTESLKQKAVSEVPKWKKTVSVASTTTPAKIAKTKNCFCACHAKTENCFRPQGGQNKNLFQVVSTTTATKEQVSEDVQGNKSMSAMNEMPTCTAQV
jgi:hypothetical protein